MRTNLTHPKKESNPIVDEIKTKFNNVWITAGINSHAIEFAERLGFILAGDRNNGGDSQYRMTTSQIRNFYGEVKRIQMSKIEKNQAAFLLLKPKLAYSAKRSDKSDGVSLFKDIISLAINAVDVDNSIGLESRFKNFCDLLEAILAYHKASGGKEN